MKDLIARIQEACEGLFYISETDAGVVPFSGGKTISRVCNALLRELERNEKIEIQERDIEEFFDRVTKIKEWHGEREKKNARRFTALWELLEKNLTDLKVFRVGTIHIEIFVLGTDNEGNVAGIWTWAVET